MSIMKKIFKRPNRTVDESTHFEVNSGKPVALPIGLSRPPSLSEQVARLMYHHYQLKADQGFESPEEADDFDCDDDMYPAEKFDKEPTRAELAYQLHENELRNKQPDKKRFIEEEPLPRVRTPKDDSSSSKKPLARRLLRTRDNDADFEEM